MMNRRHILLAATAITAVMMLHVDMSSADDGGSGSSSGEGNGGGSQSESNSGIGDAGRPDAVGYSGSVQSAVSNERSEPGGRVDGDAPGLPAGALKDIGKGSRNQNSDHSQSDQDRAFAANQKGEIISLKEALKEVSSRYDGKVIEINLHSSLTSEIYQMKLRAPDGTIKILKMDARTGKIAGLFGF